MHSCVGENHVACCELNIYQLQSLLQCEARILPMNLSFDMADFFHIPDVLADYPWKRQFNPHYAEVKEESDRWMYSFKAFSAKSQFAFDKREFGQSISLSKELSFRMMLTFGRCQRTALL